MNTTTFSSLRKIAFAASGLMLASALVAGPAASQDKDIQGLELLERVGTFKGPLYTHFAAVPTAGELAERSKLGAVLAKGAGIGLDGRLQLSETRLALTSSADPSASFEVDRTTGNFLFNGGLLKYRKDGSTPGLPQDAEAAKLALALLRRNGLTVNPAELQLVHVGGLNMAITDDGVKSQVFQKLKTVRFGRTLDGLAVEGDGRLVVHMGEAGALAGMVFQWPRLDKSLALDGDMLEKPEALRKLALEEIRAMAAKAPRSVLTRADLVLYDDGRGVIEPAYHFVLERSMDLGEREPTMIPYDFYLPAVQKALALYPQMEVAPVRPADGKDESNDKDPGDD